MAAAKEYREAQAYAQVAGEALLLLASLAAIKAMGQDSEAMTVFMAALLLLRAVTLHKKGDGAFFLLGLVLGGGNDLISMVKGVYAYTPDHWLKERFNVPMPPWMILFWGQVFLLLRHVFLLPPFQDTTGGAFTRRRKLLDIGAWAALRGVIYNTVRREPLPTLGYAGVISARLLAEPPQPHEWRLMALALILGPAVEAALIASGLYQYSDPVIAGMPVWLVLYWTFAIPLLLKGVFDRMEAVL